MTKTAQPDDFDPYRVWLGIPKSEQPANHYRLLGIVAFEDDPQVILEGADRQVAHLKTKQTGQRVALSQKLLQEVAAAAGCLLDPDAKADYDVTLKKKLALAAAPALAPATPKTELPPPPATYSPPPPPPPMVPGPTYQTPAYPPAAYPPPPTYPAAYPQPLPPAPVSAPLRPIPVPAPIPVSAPPIDSDEEEPVSISRSPSIGTLHGTRSRGRSASQDWTKLIAGGGVGLLLLIVVWTIVSRPEISAGLFAERSTPRPVAKTKPTIKPAPAVVQPIESPKPAEATPTGVPQPSQPSSNELTPEATPGENTSTVPATNPEPMTPAVSVPKPMEPLTITPAVPASEAPATTNPLTTNPATSNPVTSNPATSTTPNSESPSVPVPSKLPERTMWRYAAGLVEKDASGDWKELSPSGDYFTLTPVGSIGAVGPMGNVLEFERTGGPGRLRVYDDRLEMTEGFSGLFAEVAKGSWVAPAEAVELDPQPQAMMQQACQRYAEAIARARKKMLIQFDQALTGNKRVGKAEEQLAVIEVLTVEKQRFEDTGLVPWSTPMRAETAKYLLEVAQARGPSEALFDKAANHYVSHKDLDKANSIIALKNKVLAPLVIAKLNITDAPRPPRNPGFGFPRRREDDVPDDDNNFPTDPRTGSVRLWSNGTVNHASGKSSWTLTSTNLVLNFVRPTHTVRDTVTFNDRGDEITGKAVFSNNFSLNFTGRVTGELADHERRPEVTFGTQPKADSQ